MNVLLTNFHEGDGGGHTTYLLALARGLADAGHAVQVAAPASSRLYREVAAVDGVRALAQPFPNGLLQLLAAARARRQLGEHVRRHGIDIVHVNGSTDHRMALSAVRSLGRRPAIVLTKHNSKPARGPTHAWRARGTDAVIAVCDATRRQLEATPYARCRLHTVHNGVDLRRFRPWPAAEAAAERARWSAPGQLLIGSNAGTASHKGWMDLIEAIATLPAPQRQRVDVLLCGKSPDARQRARVRDLGLEGQVRFAGLLDDVRPVVAALDAGFVLSHAVETVSFACREMMAMGKPVLVSDYAGLPENLSHGVEGWVVPARDPRAIAAAILQLLATRDALPAMGRAARDRAEREFSLERFIAGTEAVYAGLLRQRGHAAS